MVWCGRAREWCIGALCVLGLPVACAGRSQTHADDDAGGGVAGDASTGGEASGAATSSGGTPNTGGVPSAGRGGSGAAGASGAVAQGGTSGVTASAGMPGTAGADAGEPATSGGASSGSAGSSGESGAAPGSAGEGGTPGCDGECVCEGWFADCDGDGVSGCEPLDGPENCGACGLPGIAYEHTQMVCTSSSGTYPICAPGFGDCQLDQFDCESSYADTESCLPVYLGSVALDPRLSVSVMRLGPGGEIHLAGSFEGSVDFDPGPASDVMSATGHHSVFVTKLGADGSYRWTRVFGATGDAPSWGNDLAVGPDGSVLILGTAEASAGLESAAESDELQPPMAAFVVALSADGEQRWEHTIESAHGSSGFRIAISENQEVYVVTSLEPGGPGYQGALLTKLDAAGQPLWSRAGGSSGSGVFPSGVVATTQGVIVTMGMEAGCQLDGFADPLASANPTRVAGLLASFTTNGDGIAAGFFEGQDPRSMANAHRMLGATDGTLFVAGVWEGKVDLDPGPGTSSRGLAANDISTFVARLSEDGSFVTAQALPSFGFEDMTVAGDGRVFVSGYPVNGSGSELRAFAPNLRSRFTLSFGGLIGQLAADSAQLVVVGQASAGLDIDPTNGVDLATTEHPFVARFALSAD